MLRDFFRFETEYPMKSGFRLFGPCHLVWLLSIAAFIWKSTKWYCKKNHIIQTNVNYMVGALLPVMEIYRDIVLVVTGYWNVGFLPLHLCSMALVIACLYVFWNWRYLGVVFVLLCMPGAMAALIFPNWTVYPFLSYMHIHAFTAHGLTVAFGTWLLSSGQIRLSLKDYWIPVTFGVAGIIVLYPLNKWLDTNFWFLSIPAAASPLEMIWRMTGTVWYLLGYGGLCMLVVFLWQILILRMQKNKYSDL